MKNKKIIASLLLVIVGSFLLVKENVYADDGNQQTAIVVADLNFRNPLVTSIKNNEYQIYFRMENKLPQSEAGIRYGVQLFRDNKLQDEKIYNDILSVEANGFVQKIINYTPPEYLSGGFDLWLIAKNESGLPLATFKFEKSITLLGSGEYLEIDPNLCSLKINGAVGEKKYNLESSVLVKSTETLKLDCEVVSHFRKPVVAFPLITTFYRSVFGQQVGKAKKEAETRLNPNEKKTITLIIDKPQESQIYQTKIDFYVGQKIVSLPISAQYVVSGEMATIQKFDLDKSEYQQGEAINATLFWLGSIENSKVILDLDLFDQNNQKCINSFEKELTEKNTQVKFSFLSLANCVNPRAKISLKNEQGKILAQKDFNFQKNETMSVVRNESNMTNRDKNNKIAISLKLIILFFCVVVLAGLFIFKRKTRISKILSLFVIAIFCARAQKIEAYTISNSQINDWNIFSVNISLDKDQYNKGDKIRVTTSGSSTVDFVSHYGNSIALNGQTEGCSNSNSGNIFWYGQGSYENGGGTVSLNSLTENCNAPEKSGEYNYDFQMNITGEISKKGANIDYGFSRIPYRVYPEEEHYAFSAKKSVDTPYGGLLFDKERYVVGEDAVIRWRLMNATHADLFCTNSISPNDPAVIIRNDVFPLAGQVAKDSFMIHFTHPGVYNCVLTGYSPDFNKPILGAANNLLDNLEIAHKALAFSSGESTVVFDVSVVVELVACVKNCPGDCIMTDLKNGTIPVAGECCGMGSCYACPPNETWNGAYCSSCVPNKADCVNDTCSDSVCYDGCKDVLGKKTCAVPEINFSADPLTIKSGSFSTLTWSVSGADSCSASWSDKIALNGTERVSPTKSTNYEIECISKDGKSAKKDITIGLCECSCTQNSCGSNDCGDISNSVINTCGASCNIESCPKTKCSNACNSGVWQEIAN